MSSASRIVIGWREWVALPDLGLPVIKAKVDTGARTSALHAFELKIFEKNGRAFARFRVHPLRGRSDIVVICEAPIVDHRYVSDSGGHREKRYVIETVLEIAGQRLPIEVTLANRETMSHRMLLGRSAMKALMIDPAHAFLLGRPKKIASRYPHHHDSPHRHASRKTRKPKTKQSRKK